VLDKHADQSRRELRRISLLLGGIDLIKTKHKRWYRKAPEGQAGYSGGGEHRFRRQAERHSGVKVNSRRRRSDAGMVIVE
jgi:hypothetical protein